MSAVHYRNRVARSGVDGRALCAQARRLLAALGERDSTLSLSVVNDTTMRALNREHRGKDKSTDVLSFPQRASHVGVPGALTGAAPAAARPRRAKPADPEDFLGDVVISAERARRQAADYDAPLQRELERLLIHGILHLLGYDHEQPEQRRKMEAEERRLAQAIGMPWPYPHSHCARGMQPR